MLKLSLLTEDTNKPATRFEQNVVKVLYDIFEYDYTIDQIYYEPDVGDKIMDYMKDELFLPYEISLEIYFLFNNNLSKIHHGDDSWIENPVRGYTEEASAEQMVLSKHLQVPPNFLTDEHSYYGLAHFQNEVDGHLYAVGDNWEVENAMEEMTDTMLYGLDNDPTPDKFYNSEYRSYYGLDDLVNYLYIADWAIEEISKEDAHREIEDWYGNTPEELLTQIAQKRPDIEKEWEDLQGRRDNYEEMMMNTDNDNQADLLQDKIDEIDIEIEKLSEVAKDDIALELSENNRKWMEESPLDWLYEFGYIGMDDNDKYSIEEWDGGSIYDRKKKKYPSWLRVDSKKLREDVLGKLSQYRSEELARYDGEERTEDYNGETYYIYKTE